MSKLVIGNVDSEHQVQDVSGYDAHEKSEIILCNQRMLWMASPGDVVILPTAPEPEIVEYWAKLNGCSANDLVVLAPEAKDPLAFLRQEVLFDPDFIQMCANALKLLPEDRRPQDVLAYFPDNYIAEFAKAIGLDIQDGFFREGGATLLNQKTTFRKMAGGLGVALPDGFICDNRVDLTRAIDHFMQRGLDFIVKLDRHSGGFGNVIVHGPNSKRKLLGSSKALRYHSLADKRAIVEYLIPRVQEAAVVEKYVDTDVVLYSEYFIEGPGRIELLNDGTMDMKPLWVGFEIPGDYAVRHRVQFLDYSARLVALAAQMGHRGHMNVDGLVAEGRVFVNEINGRCGGCTHIYEVAKRLFGKDVLSRKQIKTYNRGTFSSRGDLVKCLDYAGFLFHPGKPSGAIPLNVDYVLDQGFEYMVIADTLEEAREISNRVMLATTMKVAA